MRVQGSKISCEHSEVQPRVRAWLYVEGNFVWNYDTYEGARNHYLMNDKEGYVSAHLLGSIYD